jgi:hypothetical protein
VGAKNTIRYDPSIHDSLSSLASSSVIDQRRSPAESNELINK